MSWQKQLGLAHRARAAGATWAPVREIRDDEALDGRFVWAREGDAVGIDLPEDFAKAVPPGVEVTIDYARFVLTVWRDGTGAVRYRASLGWVSGGEHGDDEAALWALLDVLGDDAAPRACFFCRWSDVEAGTGWGHLGCFVDRKDGYDRYVTTAVGPKLKWVTSLGCGWVEEWHGCDEFEVRPIGYGYRGRPKPG